MAKHTWWVWLIIDVATLAMTAALLTLTTFFPPNIAAWTHRAGLWAVYPAVSAVLTALTVKNGLNAYAAWLIPPTVHALISLALTGWLTAAGAMLLYALIGVVASATGEEWGKRG